MFRFFPYEDPDEVRILHETWVLKKGWDQVDWDLKERQFPFAVISPQGRQWTIEDCLLEMTPPVQIMDATYTEAKEALEFLNILWNAEGYLTDKERCLYDTFPGDYIQL